MSGAHSGLVRNLLPVVVAISIFSFVVAVGLYAGNAFGQNVVGTARCQQGEVSGLYGQPRTNGRVGFITDWWATGRPGEAGFSYWMSLGGELSVHVGCGGTREVWGSDNFAPYTSLVHPRIICDNPVPRVGQTIRTEGRCRVE